MVLHVTLLEESLSFSCYLGNLEHQVGTGCHVHFKFRYSGNLEYQVGTGCHVHLEFLYDSGTRRMVVHASFGTGCLGCRKNVFDQLALDINE
jgi:hypothetical protein